MITADDILKQFNRMNKMPSGEKHGIEYRKLQDIVIHNQDALYDLIFSGKVNNDKDIRTLFMFGQGSSTGKDANIHWIPFFKRIWERRFEFSDDIRLGTIDWYAGMWGITE